MTVSKTAEQILQEARELCAEQAESFALWIELHPGQLQKALRDLTAVIEQETSEQCAARLLTSGEIH